MLNVSPMAGAIPGSGDIEKKNKISAPSFLPSSGKQTVKKTKSNQTRELQMVIILMKKTKEKV